MNDPYIDFFESIAPPPSPPGDRSIPTRTCSDPIASCLNPGPIEE